MTPISRYILGPDHVPTPEPDLLAWARWLETADLVVNHTELAGGQVVVSTIFLGLDLARLTSQQAPRQLFESNVIYCEPGPTPTWKFGPMERYPTWQQALAGHRRMVEHVRGTMAYSAAR